jgi:DNA mismatch endonuclease, patch repair protein
VADTLSPEERSARMALVRGKNTRPEVAVRKAMTALGYTYRLHRRDLPGSPDLVLPKFKTVIFVHGCFWHRHPGCDRTRQPKSRRGFWLRKFRENVERDRRGRAALRRAGWATVIVWECQTEDPERLIRILSRSIRRSST